MFWTGERTIEGSLIKEKIDTSFQIFADQITRFHTARKRTETETGLTQAFQTFLEETRSDLPEYIPLHRDYPYSDGFSSYEPRLGEQRVKNGVYRYFFPRTDEGSLVYIIVPSLTPSGVSMDHFPESDEFVPIDIKRRFVNRPDTIRTQYTYHYGRLVSDIQVTGPKNTDMDNGIILADADAQDPWGLDHHEMATIVQSAENTTEAHFHETANDYDARLADLAQYCSRDIMIRLRRIVDSLENVKLAKPLPEIIGYFSPDTNSAFYYSPRGEKIVDPRGQDAPDPHRPERDEALAEWMAFAHEADPLTIINTAPAFAGALQEHYQRFYRPSLQFQNPFGR